MTLSRNGKPSLLLSPNSVLANALLRSIDILRPRVLTARPARIEFVVGTQINGAPHLGTNLVQTAAFLPKSLLREHGKDVLPADVEPWMLDTTAWPGSVDDYVDALVWLVSELLTDPKHFFRSFTVKELGRLMTARPTEPVVRAHEMGIYKRYFDLITTGRKTTEIRVNDSSRQKIREGSLIRFRCQGDQVLTRVTRIARYANFDDMFAHETVASVNPLATREEQLGNIRQIYPPEREALGVVAIGIELIGPPSRHDNAADHTASPLSGEQQ